MFDRASLQFLEDFMMTSSPSGFEVEAGKLFRSYLSDCCDEVRADVLGNSIAVLNPGAKTRVMLAGHYDEIGFQVVYIGEDGLIYFRPNGGIDKLNTSITLRRSGEIPGHGASAIFRIDPSRKESIT